MSNARALCVSAPAEIASTPVSAIARTVSSLTPPLASSRALLATRRTASAILATSILSSRIHSGPAAIAASRSSSESTSTSTGMPGVRARIAATPSAERSPLACQCLAVVVFDHRHYGQVAAVVGRPATPDRVLFKVPEARGRLAGVEDHRLRAGCTSWTNCEAIVAVPDSRWRKFNATRSACNSARTGPRTSARISPLCEGGLRLASSSSNSNRRVESPGTWPSRHRDPGQHPVLLREEHAPSTAGPRPPLPMWWRPRRHGPPPALPGRAGQSAPQPAVQASLRNTWCRLHRRSSVSGKSRR